MEIYGIEFDRTGVVIIRSDVINPNYKIILNIQVQFISYANYMYYFPVITTAVQLFSTLDMSCFCSMFNDQTPIWLAVSLYFLELLFYEKKRLYTVM